MPNSSLAGVYAAAVTPLDSDLQPDLDSLPSLLAFFARRGCHGALLLGTTGEGPSFAPDERLALYRAARQVRQEHPWFRLLAGTGTPSLAETVHLTKAAFDAGFEGVVVLPPYYYRNAPEEGLFTWYSQVLSRAAPPDGALLGYHIPQVSGVPLTLDLISRLKDAFPGRFAGLKDSSGDPEFARQLGARFGGDLLVLSGNDRLLSLALSSKASGCITAVANILSPLLRRVWDAFQSGGSDEEAQSRLSAARSIADRYSPAAAMLKAILSRRFRFPRWAVHPPLMPISPGQEEKLLAELDEAGL